MQTPLVSVNIRTFNSGKTLRETLGSINKQTYQNIEIIVSDGYSKDNSVEIAKEFGSKVNFADKLGDARYKNYQHSRGKYILSLDSDQVLDRDVVEKCVEESEKNKFDALTIPEKSIESQGTFLQRLISFDKWLIDQNQDADLTFGTACPRFFRREILEKIKWPKNLAIFDDTILYEELLRKGAKVKYLQGYYIRHYEVSSWWTFMKKFYRYGKGYFGALREKPTTIAAHSLPRRSYFSKAAFTKPHYIFGLLILYGVKVTAASAGVLSYLFNKLFNRQFFVYIGDIFYYKRLEKELKNMNTVLDVGCGSWSPLSNVKKSFYSVGIDIHKPSIEEIKKKKIHDEYKVGNVLELNKIFKPKNFDAVIALDVVEHFKKEEGLNLIKQMEKIAKKKVIILTPYGFTKQHPVDGNPFQEHKSGWNISDFEKSGYKVYGMRGFRFIRTGEYATIKYKPWIFWGSISSVSQLFTFFFPQTAYQLLAVKNISDKDL